MSPAGDHFVVGQGYIPSGVDNLTLASLDDPTSTEALDRIEYEVVEQALFADEGHLLAVRATNQDPRIYRIADKRFRYLRPSAKTGWIDAARDCPRAVVVDEEGVEIYELVDDRQVWRWRGRVGADTVASISPSGVDVAIFGNPSGGVIVSTENEAEVALAQAPSDARWSGFSADGGLVGALDKYGRGAFVWETDAGERILQEALEERAGRNWSLAFDPSRRTLALGYVGGEVEVLRLDTGEEILRERAHDRRVWSLAYSPDGNRLLSGGEEGSICIWSIG